MQKLRYCVSLFALGLMVSCHTAHAMEPKDEGTGAVRSIKRQNSNEMQDDQQGPIANLSSKHLFIVLTHVFPNLGETSLAVCMGVCHDWKFATPYCVHHITVNHCPRDFLGRFHWLLSLNLSTNENVRDIHLSSLANLTKLDLGLNTQITHEGIGHLTNLTRLKLGFNTKITDEGVALLTNLKALDLGFTDTITDRGIWPLINLTDLDLHLNTKITGWGIRPLTNLTKLNLGLNTNITDGGLALLTNLTYLNARHAWDITNRGIRHLTNLTNIEKPMVGEVRHLPFFLQGGSVHMWDPLPFTHM